MSALHHLKGMFLETENQDPYKALSCVSRLKNKIPFVTSVETCLSIFTDTVQRASILPSGSLFELDSIVDTHL